MAERHDKSRRAERIREAEKKVHPTVEGEHEGEYEGEHEGEAGAEGRAVTESAAESEREITFMDVAKGAAAGAAGVWALDRVTWMMWERQDRITLAEEWTARPDRLDAAHALANRVAGAFDTEMTPEQPHPAGIATHYALGVVPGAIYGAFRHRMGGAPGTRGALFGVGLFLLQDELANAALGLSGPPTDYPWQSHARGLVGHVVFGAVVDGALELLDRIF